MTDRLRELLDPNPTDEDHKQAVMFGIRRRMTVAENLEGVCADRRALVRETMLECAKVMCEGCKRGRSLLIHPQFDGVWLHDNEGDVATECDAQEIRHLIAQSEDK